jgi:hypothetical protein
VQPQGRARAVLRFNTSGNNKMGSCLLGRRERGLTTHSSSHSNSSNLVWRSHLLNSSSYSRCSLTLKSFVSRYQTHVAITTRQIPARMKHLTVIIILFLMRTPSLQ